MRFPGFIGPSYTLQSVDADCQRCLGWYAEVNETGTGKDREIAALVGTPGLSLLASIGSGPIRGKYWSSTGVYYVVSGNTLYSVDSSWAATSVGTLGTSTGPVSMADNGVSMFLVDGSTQGYHVTMASASFTTVTSSDNFLGADQVAFLDGYFIFNKPDTGQFYISALNGVTFDLLDISSAEDSPDILNGHVADAKNLYLFGTETLEVFYDSGAADFPFERIQGAVIPIGTQAPFSIEKFSGGIAWLGQDRKGRGVVYRVRGFQPERISTHAIEKVIAAQGELSHARAWTYQYAGHEFYCLNIPGAESTWCFDDKTNLWHERATLSLGLLSRYRIDCHAFAHNTNVVGDYQAGKIYELDPDTYSDNSDPLPRIRTAPHISKDGNPITHARFELDMETGVGLTSGQGIDPQAMLQWSNDGGHTWSNERWKTIGATGEYRTRLSWNRLGQAMNRVYRVMVTDPVKSTLLGANIEVEEDAG